MEKLRSNEKQKRWEDAVGIRRSIISQTLFDAEKIMRGELVFSVGGFLRIPSSIPEGVLFDIKI